MKGEYEDYLESKDLKLYLKQIAQFPTLTPDQEKKLGKRIREGDKEALKKMIEANLKFVVSYVKRYKGMGISFMDLIHEGNIGLIEAAKRFDPERNVKFISYAVWWIRQAIIHALSHYSRIYHIPQKLSDQISEMKRKTALLKPKLGRNPHREEIAAEMGITPEEIEALELLDERNISLSEKNYDNERAFEEKVEDKMAPSVEYSIIKNSIISQIREILEELDEKEAHILKMRFGLIDDDPQTLQEIGDKLHLTRERIRQIEQKAMRKLARSQKMQKLRGYLN
ncbi:MAG: RNA polymerase sigma factor RpoD/SigA [Candidatus Aminicenantes bacterium]|nr:RNA polymerase sigma factor RpoD/SigA [Candidatus Aminicenantes bacterium]